MKVSDLLNVLNNTKVIIETEIIIYGYTRKVTVLEGRCESIMQRCSTELLEAEVRCIASSTVGLIVRVCS